MSLARIEAALFPRRDELARVARGVPREARARTLVVVGPSGVFTTTKARAALHAQWSIPVAQRAEYRAELNAPIEPHQIRVLVVLPEGPAFCSYWVD